MFPLCMTAWDGMGRGICSINDQVSIKISHLHSQLPNQGLHASVLLHLSRAFGYFSWLQYASMLYPDQRWKKHMSLLLWLFPSASWVPKPKPTSYWRSCILSTWNPYWVNGAEVQFSLVTQSYPTLCNPMDCSTPGFSVHHQILELAQTHGQSIGVSALAPVLPINIKDWFPLGWIFLQSKGLSRVFSNTTVQKHQFLGRGTFLIVLW